MQLKSNKQELNKEWTEITKQKPLEQVELSKLIKQKGVGELIEWNPNKHELNQEQAEIVSEQKPFEQAELSELIEWKSNKQEFEEAKLWELNKGKCENYQAKMQE